MTKTRRQFIQIVPLSGVALLVACSDKAPPPAAAPAPAPAAPAAAAPAPSPSPAPAPAPAPASPAATGPMVDEKDPTAVALGYVADAAQVDKTKYANYAAGQACSNCALYQGAAGSAAGPCPLFAGKQVSAKGWCASYAKKAA